MQDPEITQISPQADTRCNDNGKLKLVPFHHTLSTPCSSQPSPMGSKLDGTIEKKMVAVSQRYANRIMQNSTVNT